MKKILTIIAMLIGTAIGTAAQQPLEGKMRDEALLRIMSDYRAWSTVELNGKIQIPNLPMGIKPSLKVWMKQGEQVMLSVRAPFMGEVGRAEVTKDSLLIINKMKNVYCKESLSDVMRGFPATVGDLQALLLGRIALPGSGELSIDNASKVTLIQSEDGSVMVVPIEQEQPEGAEYGFLTRADGKLSALVVSIEGQASPVTVMYDYLISGGHELAADFSGKSRMTATLSFDRPVWGASPLSGVQPGGKYKKVSITELFRNI